MLPASIHAMAVVLQGRRLTAVQRPVPTPGPHKLLPQVRACGTDLRLIDGEVGVQGAAVLLP